MDDDAFVSEARRKGEVALVYRVLDAKSRSRPHVREPFRYPLRINRSSCGGCGGLDGFLKIAQLLIDGAEC
ncbi:hypothetical protein D3C87_1841840 [compost metagenome]